MISENEGIGDLILIEDLHDPRSPRNPLRHHVVSKQNDKIGGFALDRVFDKIQRSRYVRIVIGGTLFTEMQIGKLQYLEPFFRIHQHSKRIVCDREGEKGAGGHMKKKHRDERK